MDQLKFLVQHRIICRSLTLSWKQRWNPTRCQSRYHFTWLHLKSVDLRESILRRHLGFCCLQWLCCISACLSGLPSDSPTLTVVCLCQVVFWKWITPKLLGLVTQTAVYHWTIEGLHPPHTIVCKLFGYFWMCGDPGYSFVSMDPPSETFQLFVKGKRTTFKLLLSSTFESHFVRVSQKSGLSI